MTRPTINPTFDFFCSSSVPTDVTEDEVTDMPAMVEPLELRELDKVAVEVLVESVVADPSTTVEPEVIELNVMTSTFDVLTFRIVNRAVTMLSILARTFSGVSANVNLNPV